MHLRCVKECLTTLRNVYVLEGIGHNVFKFTLMPNRILFDGNVKDK